MDQDILNVVRLTLNTIDMGRYREDWVEHPGAPLYACTFGFLDYSALDDMKEEMPDAAEFVESDPSKASSPEALYGT